MEVTKVTRPERKFLPDNFIVSSWEVLEPFFNTLLESKINSVQELKTWFRNRSELESVIAEDMGWRYIRMTCYTDNEEYAKHYEDFVVNIQPKISPVSDALNKKAAASEYLSQL